MRTTVTIDDDLYRKAIRHYLETEAGHSVDTHAKPGVLPSIEKLEAADLKPFHFNIAQGVTSVMVGHLIVPGLTEPGGSPAYAQQIVVTTVVKNLGAVAASDASTQKPQMQVVSVACARWAASSRRRRPRGRAAARSTRARRRSS